MKINNLSNQENLNIANLEDGHLFKVISSGAIGLKIGDKYFYLACPDSNENVGNRVWSTFCDGYKINCIDLGRLVSVDEVTIE